MTISNESCQIEADFLRIRGKVGDIHTAMDDELLILIYVAFSSGILPYSLRKRWQTGSSTEAFQSPIQMPPKEY